MISIYDSGGPLEYLVVQGRKARMITAQFR
jgi:hypothetical protein